MPERLTNGHGQVTILGREYYTQPVEDGPGYVLILKEAVDAILRPPSISAEQEQRLRDRLARG